MATIQDSAKELEKAIEQSEEFQDLKAAYDKVMGDPSSNKCLIISATHN